MKSITIKEFKAEQSEKFKESYGPFWIQGEDLKESLIDAGDLTTISVNGRAVSFFEGHPEVNRIYVRSNEPGVTYKVCAVYAARDSTPEFGGHKKGDANLGLYPA